MGNSVMPASAAKKILLVEDDEHLANVYLIRLKAEGFDVRREADGEKALSTAVKYAPDLVLLDIMMPKLSGFDILDNLRAAPETTKAKIVILTARGQDSDKDRAKSLGADDYLVKSQVVMDDVVNRIKTYLN